MLTQYWDDLNTIDGPVMSAIFRQTSLDQSWAVLTVLAFRTWKMRRFANQLWRYMTVLRKAVYQEPLRC